MTATKKTGTKEVKFLNALQNGRVLSIRQAKAQYGLENPSATVYRLITEKNAPIVKAYSTKKVNGVKVKTVKYFIHTV